MTMQFAVVGVVLNRQGQVLAVSRKDDHDDLGFPGGKLEPGETAFAALRRECHEETGIYVVDATKAFEATDCTGKVCRAYMVIHWIGPAVAREGARVEWVRWSDLMTPACSYRDYNRQLFEFLGGWVE